MGDVVSQVDLLISDSSHRPADGRGGHAEFPGRLGEREAEGPDEGSRHLRSALHHRLAAAPGPELGLPDPRLRAHRADQPGDGLRAVAHVRLRPRLCLRLGDEPLDEVAGPQNPGVGGRGLAPAPPGLDAGPAAGGPEEETMEAGGSVPTGAEAASSNLNVARPAKAAVETILQPAVYKRGEFTLNRRFFETKFAGYFRVVLGEAEKKFVIIIRLAREEGGRNPRAEGSLRR